MESFDKHFKKIVGAAALAGAVDSAQAQTHSQIENDNAKYEYSVDYDESQKILRSIKEFEQEIKKGSVSVEKMQQKIVAVISRQELAKEMHLGEQGFSEDYIADKLMIDLSNKDAELGVIDRSPGARNAQKAEFDLRATGLIDQEQKQEIKYISPDYYVVIEKNPTSDGYEVMARVYGMKQGAEIGGTIVKIKSNETEEEVDKKIEILNQSVIGALENEAK